MKTENIYAEKEEVTKTFSLLMSWLTWCCLTCPLFVNTIMEAIIAFMAKVYVGNNKRRVWELGKVIKRPWPSINKTGIEKTLKSVHKYQYKWPQVPHIFFSPSILQRCTGYIFEDRVYCEMVGGKAGWDRRGKQHQCKLSVESFKSDPPFKWFTKRSSIIKSKIKTHLLINVY